MSNCYRGKQGFYCFPSIYRRGHSYPSCFQRSNCCKDGQGTCYCPSICHSCSNYPSYCQKSSCCRAWLEREALSKNLLSRSNHIFSLKQSRRFFIQRTREGLLSLISAPVFAFLSSRLLTHNISKSEHSKMSTHDELPEDIRKQIADFDQKLSALKTLKGGAREQAVGKHEKQLKRIRRLMDTYQYSIQSGAYEGKVDSHKSQYKEFEQAIARLDKTLASSRNDLGAEDDLFKNRTKSNKNVDLGSRQAVIEMGHQAQKESEDALVRIQKNVIQMDEQADVIVTELDRQIKKLDEVYDDLCDTETTLKRAEKHLKYFAKQVYTDRLMICMIIVIAIAIIVIIALAIAGKTPKAMKSTV